MSSPPPSLRNASLLEEVQDLPPSQDVTAKTPLEHDQDSPTGSTHTSSNSGMSLTSSQPFISKTRKYTLEIVQQPESGSTFGRDYLSRLPIAPPPVVRLIVTDENDLDIDITSELPFLICHVSMIPSSGSSTTCASPAGDTQVSIYGTLVSSPHDIALDNKPGPYFVFPDLSIRGRGMYSVQITLYRVSAPSNDSLSDGAISNAALAVVRTSQFSIVTREEFEVPAVTEMTREIAAQGVTMGIPQFVHDAIPANNPST